MTTIIIHGVADDYENVENDIPFVMHAVGLIITG
jgi:hypothetical protein